MDSIIKNKRIPYIDVMKGIAILSVIIGHYLSRPFVSIVIWSFHMPLFVFLNGYFYKSGDFFPRIKKSALAYLKPYVIVLLFLVVIEASLSYFDNRDIIDVIFLRLKSGFWALASNSALHKPDGVIKVGAIWFLIALFWGTIYMSVLSKVRNSILQLVILLILLLFGVYLASVTCVPLGLNYGVAFLLWLMLGKKFSIAERNNSKITLFLYSRAGAVVAFVIWLIVLCIEGYTNNTFNICLLSFPLFGLELIGAFCGIIVCMHLSLFLDKKTIIVSKAFQYLGCSSLWILCIHAIDIEIIPQICKSGFSGIISYSVVVTRFFLDIIIALLLRQTYKKFRQCLSRNKQVQISSGQLSNYKDNTKF